MYANRTKRLSVIKARLLGLIARADLSLCMDQDEWAYRLGWTVQRTGFGARRYRDPRWDTIHASHTGKEVPLDAST